MDLIKNIEKAKALKLSELVQYQTGQIVSRTLAQNKNVSITLFAFDKGEEISSHTSNGDAMVTVLDGKAAIAIGDEKSIVTAGETIVMPAGIPHAVFAEEPMKFMLTVVF
jgi:quercetin dioxygenase-like cupin family protein